MWTTADEQVLNHLAVRAGMLQAWDAIEHAEMSDGRWTFYLAYSYNAHGGIVIAKCESAACTAPALVFDYLRRIDYAASWHPAVKPALERLHAAAARIARERN